MQLLSLYPVFPSVYSRVFCRVAKRLDLAHPASMHRSRDTKPTQARRVALQPQGVMATADETCLTCPLLAGTAEGIVRARPPQRAGVRPGGS